MATQNKDLKSKRTYIYRKFGFKVAKLEFEPVPLNVDNNFGGTGKRYGRCLKKRKNSITMLDATFMPFVQLCVSELKSLNNNTKSGGFATENNKFFFR